MIYNNLYMIYAIDNENGLGKDNKLVWHLKEDLKHFREVTTDSIVIMGRNTFDSLNCKPLPNRINVVITHNPTDFANTYHVIGSDDLEYTIQLYSKLYPNKKIFIIGGATLYTQAYDLCRYVYETRIDTICNCDRFLSKKITKDKNVFKELVKFILKDKDNDFNAIILKKTKLW